jgi:hypothetical protein
MGRRLSYSLRRRVGGCRKGKNRVKSEEGRRREWREEGKTYHEPRIQSKTIEGD